MRILTSDIPFLTEHSEAWYTLPNGVSQQILWDYSLQQIQITLSFEGDAMPVVLERVRRCVNYRIGDYHFMASISHDWLYREDSNADYASSILGYQSYWQGESYYQEKHTLQPEVAVLLGFSDDLSILPAFIETLSHTALLTLLDELQGLFANDDALAFNQPAPIGPPADAPEKIVDALRRTRAENKLLITRGRAAVLNKLMQRSGIQLYNGTWVVTPEERLRRVELRLR